MPKLNVTARLNAIFKLILFTSIVFLFSCKAPQAITPSTQTSPPPPPPESASEGAVNSGIYRNLFAEIGKTPTEIRAKIDNAYQHLFAGDPDEAAIYYKSGSNGNGALGYIYDINSKDVRSEGMSYGMMITVQMNKKAEFDAIWNWAKTYMYHNNPEHPAYGYFAWSVETSGKALDEMPAPDGEEYFATALYFAAARWGNGEGIYNYQAQADRILHDMRHRERITGATTHGEKTAGNLFHPEHAIVRFTPDLGNADHTDASYHLPAFYEIWARVGPEGDRDFWAKAARVSREYFDKAAHPLTALTPDYGEFDGSPWGASWRPESVDFRYDAWRTVMNWSMDWSWWRKDKNAAARSDRLLAFFESQGEDINHLYSLDGTPLGGGVTLGLRSMNATGGLAAAHPRWMNFVEDLWQQPPPTGQYRYYDGVLYMMALLHCAGEYRAWLPE